MFCKYCGKESGESDICANCQKTISGFISDGGATGANINVTVSAQPEFYNANAGLGFRTEKTWKKIVAVIYWILTIPGVILTWMDSGWYAALEMLVYVLYIPTAIQFSTTREFRLNKWLKDKGALLQVLGVVFYIIAVALMFYIVLAIAGYFAFQ